MAAARRVLALLIVVFTVRAADASTIDQLNTNTDTLFLGSDFVTWQQEIIAGAAGRLVGIDLFFVLEPPPIQHATAMEVILGSPWQVAPPQFTAVLAPNDGWNTIDLSDTAIFLSPGDHFVISLHGLGAHAANLKGSFVPFNAGGYPGDLWISTPFDNPPHLLSTEHNWDLAFVTRMDPVPEPASVLLVASGLAFIARRRRGLTGPRRV